MHLVILPIIICFFLLPKKHFLGILLVKLMISRCYKQNSYQNWLLWFTPEWACTYVHVHEHPPPSANLLIINVYNQNTWVNMDQMWIISQR